MLTDPTLGMHSLAMMARALGRSAPQRDLLEIAAEGARETLRAASVSISRFDPGSNVLRTIINVGDLGPGEVRWPADETYQVARWDELARVLEYGATRTDSIEDPDCDPEERVLLESLGKGSSVTAAVIVDEQVWGEFYATRHVGSKPFGDTSVDYVDVLIAILGSAISRSQRESTLEQSLQRARREAGR